VNALGYTTTLDRTPWSNQLPKDAKMPPELAGLVVEAASEMRAAEERFRAAGEVAIGALQELERCEGRPIMPHDPALALILASLPEGDPPPEGGEDPGAVFGPPHHEGGSTDPVM